MTAVLTMGNVQQTRIAASRFPSSIPVENGCTSIFTGVHNNQDLTWCVKIVVYMFFWVHRGS